MGTATPALRRLQQMTLPRLFVGGVPMVVGSAARLPTPVAVHAVRALRLRQGDLVVLFDGHGSAYEGTLIVGGGGARGAVAVALTAQRTAPCGGGAARVTLAHAVCSASDAVVRAATELGAAVVVPVVSARSASARGAAAAAAAGVGTGGGAGDSRRGRRGLDDRWRAISIAACEQCGRDTLPDIAPPVSLADFLARGPSSDVRLIADPWGAPGLREATAALSGVQCRTVTLLVGPEGGWAPGEVDAAAAAGCASAAPAVSAPWPMRVPCGFKLIDVCAPACRYRRVGAGPRVLRSETAALALLAMVQAEWGDMRAGSAEAAM